MVARPRGPRTARLLPFAVALIAVVAGNGVVFAAPVSSHGVSVAHVPAPAGPRIWKLSRGLELAVAPKTAPAGSQPAVALSVREPTFEPNPASVDHRFLIVTHVTGGQPPYQFLYSGLPVGCASQNLSEITCRANVTGNYTIGVNVTDSVGGGAASAAKLRVNSDNSEWGEVWQETGLPSGTQWGVTVYGTDESTTSQQMELFFGRGYYPYTADDVPGYRATPENGSIVINDSLFTVNIAFARVLYPVTFVESGLPGGTPWAVKVAGLRADSTNATAQLDLPNGTASYLVVAPPFWRALPPSANFTVSGVPMTVGLTFVAIPTFAVSFVASGLPTGANWSVKLNGTLLSSTVSDLTTIESNGSFPFFVHPPAGWTATPDQGNVSVVGQAVQQPISFAFYRLILHETGLPQGSNWSATVNGSRLFGATANLSEGIAAGTYAFSVNASPPWTATPEWGSIVVGPGSTGVAEIRFAGPIEKSNVTFAGTGLPTNMTWSVHIAGLDARAGALGFELQLPNGSYPFAVDVPNGWAADPASGTVVVIGQPVHVQISFAVPGPPTPGLLGADPQAWFTFTAALGGSLAVGLLAGLAVVRLRARRR